MLRHLCYVLAASVLADPALAQDSLRSRLRPITGEIKHAGTLHVGTGSWTRRPRTDSAGVAPAVVYTNTCFTGYYAGMQQGEIFTDEGAIPNYMQPSVLSTSIPGGYDKNPGCQLAYNVTSFEIAYCTYFPGPQYAVDISFYDMVGPAGTNCSIPGTPTATFSLTGLPGDTFLGGSQACWIIQLDLTATSQNFALTGTGGSQNNIFGWSYEQVSPSHPATPEGMLIAGGVGSPSPQTCTGTDGTRWDNGVASVAYPNNVGEEGTGMFNLDAFRSDGVTSSPGCHDFLGNPRGSFHLALSSMDSCEQCLFACAGTPYCFGDGTTTTACPCGNFGATGAGCNNSIGNGGAELSRTGVASLTTDTLVFTQVKELPTSFSIFLQGTANVPNGVVFGDGVRCVGGSLKRLYDRSAVGGTVSAPTIGVDPSVSAMSASLGDTILPGSSRFYAVYYRDSNATFCPNPPGNTWNIGNSYEITWQS